MYPDEYLNYFADKYVAERIGAHGVSLEQYLAEPARYARLALEPEPLLPAQRAVADWLAAGDEHDALTAGLDSALADSLRGAA